MDLLLSAPSAQDKYAQAQQMLGGSTGPSDPRGLAEMSIGGNPSGEPVDLAWEIARRLERKGFEVGGLEGFQGIPQSITSGHIDNSQHYSGMAGDVTYGGDGRWGNQDAALNWVENMLQRRYGDQLSELIWQEPDHYDHLHYGTRPGG